MIQRIERSLSLLGVEFDPLLRLGPPRAGTSWLDQTQGLVTLQLGQLTDDRVRAFLGGWSRPVNGRADSRELRLAPTLQLARTLQDLHASAAAQEPPSHRLRRRSTSRCIRQKGQARRLLFNVAAMIAAHKPVRI